MTTRPGQDAIQGSMDQMLEAFIKEMIEPGSNPKAASRTEDAVTAALAGELREVLTQTVSQGSSFEKAMFVATLAPALAEALAPVLAEALVPALMEAFNKMAAPEKTSQESTPRQEAAHDQESAPGQGSDHPE